MARFTAAFLVFLLLAAPALGDPQLQQLSTEELVALRDQISLELAARSASADALASWEVEGGRVELLSIQRGLDRDGVPSFSLVFALTNLSNEPATFYSFVKDNIYQDGYECDWTFVNGSDGMLASKKILPGGTFANIIRGYKINAETPDIVIELTRSSYPYDSFGFRTVTFPAE